MSLLFDLKYAWRLLFKTPGYSLLCAIVVALSVGVAVFAHTLAYSQAWKPLPFPGSDSWLSIQVSANAAARPVPNLDIYTYQELRKHHRSGTHLGGFSSRTAVLSEGEASASLNTGLFTPDFFKALQSAPEMGRLLEEKDSLPGATPVVILSFDAWQNYFAADPAIVGKQARIDGQPVQIIGVMPKDFYSFQNFALFRPLPQMNLSKPSDSKLTLTPFFVLGQDQTVEAALAEMKSAVDTVNRNYPELFDAGRHLALIPGHQTFTHLNLQVVAMVSFIAGAVLLLGCVNISLIFFARLLERGRELALRTALGSSRWRLLRLCLLESVLVVFTGLLLGLVLASLFTDWTHWVAETQDRIRATGDGGNVPELSASQLAVAVLSAVVLWLLSTLTPAWRIAKQDAAIVLAGGGKGMIGAGSAKSANLLVGLQVAISCLVLVICANLVFAVNEETSKPRGINSDSVMLSSYATTFTTRHATAPDRVRYWDELSAAIKSRMPGAEVAYSSVVPLRPSSIPVAVENREGSANQGTHKLPVAAVSNNYFDLLGINVRSGRLFDNTDDETSLNVAVIDEKIAKRYWPGEDPLHKRIQLNPTENGPWLTIVGVTSPVGGRLYHQDAGVVYQPLRQAVPGVFHLVAKLPNMSGDNRAVLRAAAFAVDRDLPLHNLQWLGEYLDALTMNYTLLLPVFIAIGLITSLLAATGLFGLISRSVARRTHEVGMRRALGGTQWQVTALFLRQGAVYLGVGVVGGGFGMVVANLMSASIPNVLTNAALAAIVVLVLMTAVIFAASYLPTRRAVTLEPGDALRYE